MKKILFKLLLILSILGIYTVPAYAATASIKLTPSSSSVIVGNNVSVTVTLSSSDVIGVAQFNISYDTAKVDFVSIEGAGAGATGGAGIVSFAVVTDGTPKSLIYKINFKTKALGSAAFTIQQTGVVFANWDGVEISPTLGNTSVNITAQPTASTNNNLMSLSISPGSLSPAFNPSTTSYTTSVGYDVNSLVVSAKAANENAKVAVSGHAALKEGSNTINIVVTAQSGAQKTYTITVNKTANPTPPEIPKEEDIAVNVNGEIFYVVKEATGIEPPLGFIQSVANIDDQVVLAWTNDNMQLTIVRLKNEETDGQFYIYDEENESFQPFVAVESTKLLYVILDHEGIAMPSNYKQTTITLNGIEHIAYKINEDDEMALVYAMGSDGVKAIYQYDTVQGTFQRYIENEVPTASDNTFMFYAFGLVVLILLIVIFIIVGKMNTLKQFIERNKLRHGIKETTDDKWDL